MSDIEEREAFVAAVLPHLVGECIRPKDIGSWCGVHASVWPSAFEVCVAASDAYEIIDRAIEAWQERKR